MAEKGVDVARSETMHQLNAVALETTNTDIISQECICPLLCTKHGYIYIIYVVLNRSSQELPFRKSFACFRGPIGVAFSKIENSYQAITSLL